MAFAITPASIGIAVAAEIPDIFDDALDTLREGEAEYLRNGIPDSIVGKLSQAAGRSACRIYGTGDINLTGAAAERYERVCRPYLDSISPGQGASLAVPFQGGQCAGTVYQCRYLDTSVGTSIAEINSNFKTIGPVGGFRTAKSGGNIQGFITSRGAITGSSCGSSAGGIGAPSEKMIFSVLDRGQTGGTFSITGVCSGLNNCGNPPPEVRQPRGIPNPIGPTERVQPEPGFDVDLTVGVGNDGQITFNIGTGPITVDPFGGPGDGGGGGGGTESSTPGDSGGTQETGAGGADGQGGTAEGDAPPGKVLTGVRVNIIEAPPSRRRFTESVDRGVAYVYMGLPSEGLALEPTGATVTDGQFFFAQKNYLTRHRVRANFGYNLAVTPFYKDAD